MKLLRLVFLGTVALAGCSVDHAEIGREPNLTPVGAGLRPDMVPVLDEPPPLPRYRRDNSLWEDKSADLFLDPRARTVGDVLTVKIAIKDEAKLDNKSNRARNADRSLGLFGSFGAGRGGGSSKWEGELDTELSSETKTRGEGAIRRSETIQLRVAAVVSAVLPNGNLVISGSQEVRVNYEVRVLTVAGVVRPRDIEPDNTISYDKIAEARISYGGRGRIMEVQQPGWGQQLLDIVLPF